MLYPVMAARFHYIFDAENVELALLTSEEKVGEVLVELARAVGMKILSGPHVARGVPENPGVSGFCIIDYSHISIHTFTETREFFADIFSCKPYDPERVRVYLAGVFRLGASPVRFFRVEYPVKQD